MSKRLGCMIDLESVGMGYWGAMVQIGAVLYDTATFEIESEFCMNINHKKLPKSFIVEDHVIEWWRQQDKEVIKSVFSKPQDPELVAEKFLAWIKKESGGRDFELFSNHILFDITKTDNFLDYYVGQPISTLTKYNMIEDFATIRNRAKWKDPELLEEMEAEYTQSDQHNALADCKWQLHLHWL